MVHWQRIGETTVTQVGWRIITRKNYRFPNGKEFPFDVIGREGDAAASVFALTPDNHLIISEQYRPGPDRSMIELPGGFADPGEDPETAARRELLEETGYEPAKIVYVGAIHKEAYTHLKVHYFIAYDCKKVAETEHEPTEYIEVKKMSIGDFLEVARGGGTTNTEGVLMAYDILKDIQKQQERV